MLHLKATRALKNKKTVEDKSYCSKVAYMDDRYNISKSRKPETKVEILAAKIEELVKQRDRETSLPAKQAINAEITKLFAQYERLKL